MNFGGNVWKANLDYAIRINDIIPHREINTSIFYSKVYMQD